SIVDGIADVTVGLSAFEPKGVSRPVFGRKQFDMYVHPIGISISKHEGTKSTKKAVGIMLESSLRAFGTPGQAWSIYLTERSQTCKLLVQHVAAASRAG
ncbi:MAG TPA: hypothetical protein PKV86_07520, partial [Syntrophobacteraceae bacterium]|nr:hypothetical protein [Syntrophobacteraceae bacterium]